jgi:MFS transporter, OFA family, oxalate/formate antiporter
VPRNWSNIPFPPARFPFFYGWVLLAATTVGIVASIPGQTMGVGIFTDFLIEELGLTRSQLSLAYAIGTIASGFLLPMAGSWVDRFGVRVTGVAAAIGLGLSLVVLSHITGIAAALPFGTTLAPMSAILGCFLCLRFFGQGCITMIARVAIGRWFDKRRGRAVALMGIVTAFSFNSSPNLLNYLVNTYTWRGAALVLAAMVGLGMTVITILFYRDTPESCGLTMDGHVEPETDGDGPSIPARVTREFTRREASRTLAFWAYSFGPSAQGLVMTAVTFHMASLGAEAGLDRDTAYDLFIPMALFSVLSNTVGGWLSDRIDLKWILAFMMVTQAGGILGLTALNMPLGQAFFILGYGCSGGLFATMTTVPFPRFFGREHLGAISGLNMSIMVFASALGPYLFSAGFDYFGSYEEVTLACLAMPAAVIVVAWMAGDPQKGDV